MPAQPPSELGLEILRLFREANTEGLDLHTFFEVIAGDDRKRRQAVLEAVERLEASGYLEGRGSDFYTLTDDGLRAASTRLDG